MNQLDLLVLLVCLAFGLGCVGFATTPIWRPLWTRFIAWTPVEDDDAPKLPVARVRRRR